MIWQEYVFALGGLFFASALVPMLKSKETQVPRKSSVGTAAFLFLFVFAFASLGQWLSAGTQALVALGWTGLAIWRPVKARS